MDKIYFHIDSCREPYVHINCIERTAGYSLPEHCHADFWQVIVVTEGELCIIADGKRRVLTRGDVHILPRGCRHALESDGYRQIGIDFYEGLERFGSVTEAFSRPCVVKLPSSLEYARRICELDTVSGSELMYTLCDLILLSAAEVVSKRTDPLRQRLIEYIDSAPSGVSLDSAAAELFISPSHLERRTNELFGMGFVALANRHRFERACAQLIGTELSVRRIGESLGFTEPSNFSAFFKRYSGISPSDYRKRYYRDSSEPM